MLQSPVQMRTDRIRLHAGKVEFGAVICILQEDLNWPTFHHSLYISNTIFQYIQIDTDTLISFRSVLSINYINFI